MANNNVIDELQLKIGANGKEAIENLEKLASGLNDVARSVKNVETASRTLGTLTTNLTRLSTISTRGLNSKITALEKLSKLDFSNIQKPLNIQINDSQLTTASGKLKDFQTTMASISTTGVKGSGITSFLNSVRRLSEVDLSKFKSTTFFDDIAAGIGTVAAAGDISGDINRLVSSLARLASAGDKVSIVTDALPNLSEAIQKVASGLASSGGIPNEINAFVAALASLANAGNRTGITASQLGELSDALLKFFASMQQAPVVSENALRMTEALGQLASAGSKTGAATKSVTASINKIGSARLDGIKGAIKDLGTILERVAGKAKSAASKIYNAIKKIGTARPSIQSTTSAIKTMIGAMIGFQGITGFANLLKQTVELGANLTEIDHIIESVFGDHASYVDAWAKNAITQFGIAEHSAKQYAGVLSSMFQASQIGYKDAGKMAMDLVGLAGKQVAA